MLNKLTRCGRLALLHVSVTQRHVLGATLLLPDPALATWPTVQVVNNVVSDVVGAAFGAWGGYNILFAHNTAYRQARLQAIARNNVAKGLPRGVDSDKQGLFEYGFKYQGGLRSFWAWRLG